jgi:hypothetical protein
MSLRFKGSDLRPVLAEAVANQCRVVLAKDLDLLTVNGRTLEGNCDLCFLKPRGQRLALIKARPEAAVWRIRMESLNLASKPSGARFRADGPSYADLARFAADQGDLFDAAEEPIACFCGD